MPPNEKADAVVRAAESQMGNPYVFGAWGGFCTPAYRKKYAGYNPQHKDKIYRACPVLSGKQSACDGCPWQGKRAFDCRGFTYWCLSQAGIILSGGGATSQFDTKANWERKGPIAEMPDLVCCVFKDKNGTKTHTGLHIGGGDIDHCSGTVKRGRITDKGWTHYAIPKGLYTAEELENAKEETTMENHQTLRKGSTGPDVLYLQTLLSSVGDPIDADGAFGPKTAAAVKAFQKAHGLTVDGVVGPKTWAALESATGHDEEAPDDFAPEQPDEDEPAPEPPDGDAPIIPAPDSGETVTMSLSDFNALKAADAVIRQIVKKYEAVG